MTFIQPLDKERQISKIYNIFVSKHPRTQSPVCLCFLTNSLAIV